MSPAILDLTLTSTKYTAAMSEPGSRENLATAGIFKETVNGALGLSPLKDAAVLDLTVPFSLTPQGEGVKARIAVNLKTDMLMRQ